MVMEAQEMSFQHARKDHAKCQLQQGGKEGNSLKVSIGFSHKIVINDLQWSDKGRSQGAGGRIENGK